MSESTICAQQVGSFARDSTIPPAADHPNGFSNRTPSITLPLAKSSLNTTGI